ncbi:unnamed protein product [Dicrocoelium dendriticum]|nr:unnamed protein product [Dicrocoelium dendriticum]
MWLLFLVASIVFVPLHCSDYLEIQNVQPITKEMLENPRSSNFLVIFHRTSCPACHSYLPIFKKLVAKISDCDDPKDEMLCDEQNIHGVPSIRFYSKQSEASENFLRGEFIVPSRDDEILGKAVHDILVKNMLIPYDRRQIVRNNTTVYEPKEAKRASGEQLYPTNYRIDPVYADDIYISLSKLLFDDISSRVSFNEEDVKSVQEFMHMLKLLMPGSPYYKRKIAELSDWVDRQDTLTGKQWSQHLKDMKFPVYRGEHVACKGSSPGYRGYTCGLWLLFHSLTVRHFELASALAKTPGDLVAHALHRFVPRMFSCRTCAFHFAANTANIARPGEDPLNLNRESPSPDDFKWDPEVVKLLPKAPTTPREEILWLNAVHNRVNKRLAGDSTEDPEAPKVLYPPAVVCPGCWSKNSDGHPILGGTVEANDRLLAFLVSQYRSSSWKVYSIGEHFFDVLSLYETEQKTVDTWLIVSSVLITVLAIGAILVLARLIWPFRRRRYAGAEYRSAQATGKRPVQNGSNSDV